MSGAGLTSAPAAYRGQILSAAEAMAGSNRQQIIAIAAARNRVISAPHPSSHRRTLSGSRLHADFRHHATVLVVEDVAVVNEIPNHGPPEIHPHLDVRVFPFAGPVPHLEGVVPLLLLLG